MLTDFQRQKLPRLFAVHDLNRDGVVNWADFEDYSQRIARTRGWGADSKEYRDLLSRFVSFWTGLEEIARNKGARQITITEWYEAFDRILNTPGMYDEIIDPIGRMVFTILDADGDGSVTLAEYTDMFEASGLDPADAAPAFGRLDLDRDGKLSVDEVMVLADQFFRSNDPSEPGNALFGIVSEPLMRG